ncbi:MAG: hypothetical protein LPK45_05830, partial [Bacteroidota bacterium]|nr:hypothetical protein [Bacteroidota bacterium]MDX5430586.1 hypothetical protein [Bacteroidota bacterium]MDX5469338.1 hypothetical protein [Bacteroidota bacterium]
NTNEYTTDNAFQMEYLSLEMKSKNFLALYRDSSNVINPVIEKFLPYFIDSLNHQIQNHSYEEELRATLIYPF